MKVAETELAGVLEITPDRFEDDRGWFSEVWSERELQEHGIDITWVQDNESVSAAVGTIRGLHFQTEPVAQDKLVRAVSGRILDVAVDVRRSSATFGVWVSRELDSAMGNQLLIPKGFAHGFATLEPDCHVAYKVSAPYSPSQDRSIAWNDPTLDIDWGLAASIAVLSTKDLDAPLFADAELFD